MNIHIIGICGTFMGGIARIATQMGFRVSGSDAQTYPPMSTQLNSLGIKLFEGYNANNIADDIDIVIVGNTISRGNEELEHVLNQNLAYTSGAQWLGDNVLRNKWVLAVAGTHGKTTTASMLAWILQDNGFEPGYLIGGVAQNFDYSANLGRSDYFVIEADEYDTAFSDKRSKFLHYHARTLVLNNLEFDHADIFDSIKDIQKQFHHLLKTVPSTAQIIVNADSPDLEPVIERGCYSKLSYFADNANSGNIDWKLIGSGKTDSTYITGFVFSFKNKEYQVNWNILGKHNQLNAIAAISAAHQIGIDIESCCRALSGFKTVKRRLEVIFDDPRACIFDDFAHHPTAISETLSALREHVGDEPIIAVLEPRSNTMKRGVHKHKLNDALAKADQCMIFANASVEWDVTAIQSETVKSYHSIETLVADLINRLSHNESLGRKTHVLIMSNGGFEGIYDKITIKLSAG